MRKMGHYTFSELLRQFRVREGLSQQELAKKLYANRNTIIAWENGDSLPKTWDKVDRIATALRLNQEDTDILLKSWRWKPSVLEPSYWKVPYRRNPFFTGREEALTQIHTLLVSDRLAGQPLAISGLAGIGKTQTAVEYAYRYKGLYQAILWANADSYDIFVSEIVNIAHLLDLPQKNEPDQARILAAFQQWLEETSDWLLILDNLEDLAMGADFLPARHKGYTLITTRQHVTGTFAHNVTLQSMTEEKGALFLLRRAQIIESQAPLADATQDDRTKAVELVKALDGLPLALDQAATYIDEAARSLSEYLALYKTHQTDLLRRSAKPTFTHHEPVASTWFLSFQKIQVTHPAAVELLTLCTFLQPDAIPEEILTLGAEDLGPLLQFIATDPLKLADTITELRRYALIQRDPKAQTLIIHRLLQAALKNELDREAQHRWAQRAVRAVARAFPEVDFPNWERCQRCVPHVHVCATLIKEWNFIFPEAAQLLERAGQYLKKRARYQDAQLLLEQALRMYEQVAGPLHSLTAQCLNEVAMLYVRQGLYSQAKPLYLRALGIFQQHPECQVETAITLNNLGRLYEDQGEYVQAESSYQRALQIYEQTGNLEHIEVAITLNNLGLLSYKQKKYAQAEAYHNQSLQLRKKKLLPDDPDLAPSLNNLALVYDAMEKYAQAETLYKEVIRILENSVGPEHPNVASTLNNLADIYRAWGRYDESEQLHQRALTIRVKHLGNKHPHVAISLHNLARLYQQEGKHELAERFYQQALDIRKRSLGEKHPETVQTLNSLKAISHL